MKRSLVIVLFLACVLLTACNSTSIGVIGGEDGPTSIIVGKTDTSNEKTIKDTVRIVNVKGELYYDTDEESETKAKCGVMDGNFTKTVDIFEIPKNDGESNFSEGDCYQTGKNKNTIEIPIGDDWEIFKKIDTNQDVLKYFLII